MVIGVTGGIGSGKSLFCRQLEESGALVIDVDKVARELADKNKEIRQKIKDNFGTPLFDNKGKLHRKKLAQLVFTDKRNLRKLNSIFYPPLLREIRKRIRKIQNRYQKGIIVVDMAVIFEAQAEELFDFIVVVDAPLDLRIKRLKKDRGWTKKEITDRINSQMEMRDKIHRSNFVILNNGSVKELAAKALNFFDMITTLKNGGN